MWYVCFKFLISFSIFTSQSTYASDFDVLSSELKKAGTLINESEAKLKADLIFYEILIDLIEQGKQFNQTVGFDTEYGLYIAVPNFAVLLFSYYSTAPKISNIIDKVTPNKSILDNFILEHDRLKKEEITALRELKKAKKDQLSDLDIDVKNKNLSHAILQRQNFLRTQPGVFYKLGRILRNTSKGTLAVSGIALTVAVAADFSMLLLPKQSDEFLDQLKSDVQQLNQILYPELTDVQVQ